MEQTQTRESGYRPDRHAPGSEPLEQKNRLASAENENNPAAENVDETAEDIPQAGDGDAAEDAEEQEPEGDENADSDEDDEDGGDEEDDDVAEAD
jgi:hypothetical protein